MKTKLLTFLAAAFFPIFANAQSNFAGSGISLSFNGNTGNSVSLGDVYNDLQFPFTIESWIYLNQYPTDQTEIFASDNSTSTYYGFWFAVDSKKIPGQLRVEFGNAQGGGYQYREGMTTTSLVPLNKWIHVSAVCKSPTNIQIYFNGVAQPMEKTDGTASISNIIHSSDGASIGWRKDEFGSFPWNGQLDEIRLWNVSRSETEIRDHMCQKLGGNETGLIGYWTADESYTSNTVLDYTSPAENGTIVGTVGKVTSGAAIGNMSTHVFTNSWKGVSLSLSSSGKDKFAVKSIKNNPFGVYIYRVDTFPYNTAGLNQYPNYYFGAFTVDNGTAATYDVDYHYSFNNGVVNSQNQSLSSLFERTDGSYFSWGNVYATLNQGAKQLSETMESGRKEYILNNASKDQSNSIGSGIALTFNGDNANSVSLGDVYNDLQFPFTIEAWIYLNQYPTNQTISTKIFSSDNSATVYYGFWFAVDSKYIPGQCRVEFGNSLGGGYQYREGMTTTTLVPLKKWVHVAAVCKSPTDIQIYFNAVAQPMEKTDGAASISSIIHSPDGASIGWQQTEFGSRSWNGQLDEIRLWNVSRSETEIRDHMCQKLGGNETGLIGYWTADESYTSNTVLDYTSPAENGTIVGTVGKVTSGAAIGNMSTHVFTNSWKGVSLSLSSSGKDKFAVKAIKQHPYGVFIYRVDSTPFLTTGLNKYPAYYFGVFTADSTAEAKYNVYYHYSFNNGVVDSENQSSCSLFKRSDGSGSVWADANATLDTNSKELNIDTETDRGEYILNLNNSTVKPELRADKNQEALSAYPNPFSNQLNIESELSSGEIMVVNATGETIYHSNFTSPNFRINTSEWANGVYVIRLKNENQTFTGKAILSR